MTYLYAGLGMAMLTAIMAMFEMATGITNQQMTGLSAEDAYTEAGVAGIDQALLGLSVKGLEGWSNPEPIALCGRVKELIDSDPLQYSLLNPKSPAFNYRNSFVESDPSLVPLLIRGCEVSAPIASDASSRHRVVIAPVMESRDGVLRPVLPHRYTLWSCVTRSLCLHEETL